jgi:hypothetical protein
MYLPRMAAFLFRSCLVARRFLRPACSKASRLMAASVFGSTAGAVSLVAAPPSEWVPYRRPIAEKSHPRCGFKNSE